jgi:hypothetical protein
LIYPKKYLSHTNKSLRQFNLKLVPNPGSNAFRHLPILQWILRPKTSLGEGGVKVVLNQRGGIEGEFIEGWEMFREDFWEEEEKRIQEDAEAAKRDRKQRKSIDSGSGRSKSVSSVSSAGKKKKKSISGSVSSIKTSSTNGGSTKKIAKKKKRTAEQAVAEL